MPLRIETFDNTRGGNTLYKALTHPAAARLAQDLLDTLAKHAPIAVYDPSGAAEPFDAIFNLAQIEISEVFVQQVAQIGATILGRRARPLLPAPGVRYGFRCRAHHRTLAGLPIAGGGGGQP
jgi:hypothetical protein